MGYLTLLDPYIHLTLDLLPNLPLWRFAMSTALRHVKQIKWSIAHLRKAEAGGHAQEERALPPRRQQRIAQQQRRRDALQVRLRPYQPDHSPPGLGHCSAAEGGHFPQVPSGWVSGPPRGGVGGSAALVGLVRGRLLGSQRQLALCQAQDLPQLRARVL